MSIEIPFVDNETQARIASEIDKNGFSSITGYIDDLLLTQLRTQLSVEASKHCGGYFSYHGAGAFTGTSLGDLGISSQLQTLLEGIHRHGAGKAPHSKQIFQVLRCVQGATGLKESNYFHFDATLLTALVPIEIPQEGDARGDLILFPNLRRVQSSVLLNVLEKALLQNALSRRILTAAIRLRWLKPRRLQLVPGNIYFFWGYRTLHANEPCHPTCRRATALFHYGDPHAGSLTTRLILKLNQRRARRSSANDGQPAL